jgi:hypothetical protein
MYLIPFLIAVREMMEAQGKEFWNSEATEARRVWLKEWVASYGHDSWQLAALEFTKRFPGKVGGLHDLNKQLMQWHRIGKNNKCPLGENQLSAYADTLTRYPWHADVLREEKQTAGHNPVPDEAAGRRTAVGKPIGCKYLGNKKGRRGGDLTI